MSKRVKIKFDTNNKGKYEIIPPEKIAETIIKIKKAMRELKKRKLKKKKPK
jgi:hypothetical protein